MSYILSSERKSLNLSSYFLSLYQMVEGKHHPLLSISSLPVLYSANFLSLVFEVVSTNREFKS